MANYNRVPTHQISCPLCGEIIKFYAEDDQRALVRAMKAAQSHMSEKHSDEEISQEEMQKMVKNKVKRIENKP